MRVLHLLALLAAAPAAWTAPAAPALSSAASPPAQARDSITAVLDSLAHDPNGVSLHGVSLPAASVHMGADTIPAHATVDGSVAAWHGPLVIHGTVTGDAVSVGGDVVIGTGGTVRGDAISVGGQVREEGGTVVGERRTLSALTVGAVPAPVPRTAAQIARRSISLAVGWYLVLAVIGVFVALFARTNLETIAHRIRAEFSRSFLYGLLGQIAFLPALVLAVVLLCITVVGILLVPFAVVAFILAGAGALALGFVAMSYATGEAVMRWRGALSLYGPTPILQCLLLGLSGYLILWMVGGSLAWAGWLGTLLRLITAAVTWAAITVGFGATLASRGGTRTARAVPTMPPPAAPSEYEWQTPTPVTGVAAARRPTPPPVPRQPGP